MKTLIGGLFLLLCVVETKSLLSPGTQTKISTMLDLSISKTKGIMDHLSKTNKAMDEYIGDFSIASKTIHLNKIQNKALKSARVLKYLVKGLQTVSVFSNLAFTFFMSSELEETMEKFNQVNQKLDFISEKITIMTKKIKTSVEFNNVMQSFHSWENNILNGQSKLHFTRKGMKSTNNLQENLKRAEIYIRYFEEKDIEGSMRNIHRAATIPQSTTHHNLFEKFTKEYRCDVKALLKLFVLLKGLLQNGAEQSITYYQYKGMTIESDQILRYAQEALYEVRYQFDIKIIKCMKETIKNAEMDVKEIIDTNNNAEKDWLARSISTSLLKKYPWYSWSVAVVDHFEEILRVTKDGSCSMYSCTSSYNFIIEDEGTSFKKINDYGRKWILLVWQDSDIKLNCNERYKTNTRVFYECARCTKDHLITDPNMLSIDKCGWSFLNSFIESMDTDLWWVAGKDANDSCIGSNFCGNHGTCHKIPQIGNSQCVCHPFYEGERCEEHVVRDSDIDSLMVDIRASKFFEGIDEYTNSQKSQYSNISVINSFKTLKWQKTQIHDNKWTEWSPWSNCSMTCGGGIQTRKRTCMGQADVKCYGEDEENKKCSTQSCCPSRYGKFECKTNDECIDGTKRCDGIYHCTDGSDESKEECPDNIFHGDLIALKNIGVKNRWLSCYCTINCGYKTCKVRECPGSHMDDSDWEKCNGNIFKIFKSNGSSDSVIREGDEIALIYNWDMDHGYNIYFNCFLYNEYCTAKAIGNKPFQIRGGGHGKPIKLYDTVFLKHQTCDEDNYYVTGMGYYYDVYVNTCPSNYGYTFALKRCTKEAWKIYRK